MFTYLHVCMFSFAKLFIFSDSHKVVNQKKKTPFLPKKKHLCTRHPVRKTSFDTALPALMVCRCDVILSRELTGACLFSLSGNLVKSTFSSFLLSLLSFFVFPIITMPASRLTLHHRMTHAIRTAGLQHVTSRKHYGGCKAHEDEGMYQDSYRPAGHVDAGAKLLLGT
jgi:hypothetical protein